MRIKQRKTHLRFLKRVCLGVLAVMIIVNTSLDTSLLQVAIDAILVLLLGMLILAEDSLTLDKKEYKKTYWKKGECHDHLE